MVFRASAYRYGPTVIGKYTKGIGQVEARFPTDDEARKAFDKAFKRHRIRSPSR